MVVVTETKNSILPLLKMCHRRKAMSLRQFEEIEQYLDYCNKNTLIIGIVKKLMEIKFYLFLIFLK